MHDDLFDAAIAAGAAGNQTEYWRLLSEHNSLLWAPDLLDLAVEVAAQHGCILERSSNGLGSGWKNLGGLRIKDRKTGRIIAGRRFELDPPGVLQNFVTSTSLN